MVYWAIDFSFHYKLLEYLQLMAAKTKHQIYHESIWSHVITEEDQKKKKFNLFKSNWAAVFKLFVFKTTDEMSDTKEMSGTAGVCRYKFRRGVCLISYYN